MIIKVCGMRDTRNIGEVDDLCPQWMGFIFWPKSSRFVSQKPDCMPAYAQRVGVFVDENVERVKQTAADFSLGIIQLHGKEPPEYADGLRKWKVVKAFNIAAADDLEQTRRYEGHADYFLFDTKAQLAGGNGLKFDWDVLRKYQGHTPFLLSGGIGPDDAERVKAFQHPRCAGIDLNSRFETAPGLKDVNKLREFIKKIRE